MPIYNYYLIKKKRLIMFLKKIYKKVTHILWVYPCFLFSVFFLNIYLLKFKKIFAIPCLPFRRLHVNVFIGKKPSLKIFNLEIFYYFRFYAPKKNDAIIDAGSYHGEFSLLAHHLIGKKGKIICFEPDKKNAGILSQNLKKNGLKNAIIINKGLWSKKKELFIKPLGDSSFLSNKGKLSEKVKVCDLDSCLKKMSIKKVDFIKMDVEGAELEALKGMEKTLKNGCNLAIASYHLIDGKKSYKKCEDFLKKRGYFAKTCNNFHLTTYAWK